MFEFLELVVQLAAVVLVLAVGFAGLAGLRDRLLQLMPSKADRGSYDRPGVSIVTRIVHV
jgi:hypothetical protein